MKSLQIILLTIFTSGLLFAQNYAISDLNILSLLNQDISIVRSDHFQLEFQSENKMTVYRKKATTFLEDPGRNLSPKIYYNDLSDIKDFDLNIYDAAGNLVQHYNKRDVKDEARLSYSIYTDTRVQFFELGAFDFPLTVEYEYQKKIDGIMRFSPWIIQDFDQKVEYARCDINVDDEVQLYYRLENSDVQPKITDDGKEIQYTWILEDLPAIEKEPYAPHALNILPSLQYSISHFKVDNFEGSARTWSSFGNFLQQFYDDAQDLPNHVKEEIQHITAPISNDGEKIKVLYDYLQDNTRYVSVQIGIGGWKTYDAEYVAENKYGDCKALSNYLGTLLSEVGIESYPIIIESNENAYAVPDDFVFDRFNHAILYVPSENMFVECTATSGPEGYIGSHIQARNALLVDGAESRLVRTPDIPFHENRKTTTTQIHINVDAPSTISSREIYEKHRHEEWRMRKDHYDRKFIEKKFREHFPLTISALESLSIRVSNELAEAKLNYSLHTKEIGSSMGKRIFLDLNPLYRANISLPEDEDRILPIKVNQKGVDSNIIWYHLPEEYVLESMPDSPITYSSKWGKYKLSFEFTDPNTLKVSRYFEFYKVNESADQYEKIKKFYDKVLQTDLNTKIVLVKE